MDQRYTDFRLGPAAFSSSDPGSRFYVVGGSPWSEVQEGRPHHYTANLRYGHYLNCDRGHCYCPSACDYYTEYDGDDAGMSGGGRSIESERPLYEGERLASQTTDDGFGNESYGMTERQAGYGQDEHQVAVSSGLQQQYSNTGPAFYPSQTTSGPAYTGSSSGPPGFDALADQSSIAAAQDDDQNITGHGNDNDDDETIASLEDQDPAKRLLELEALYEPGVCQLGGCRQDYFFQNFHSCRSHIKNVHHKALWCLVTSCPHPRPFGNQSDLNRHTAAKHGDKTDKPYKCLRADCTARARAFKRKDKLKEHDRKYHAEYRCFICPRDLRFESEEEWYQHTNDHGYAFSG